MKFTSSPSSSSSTFPASKDSVFGCLSFVLRRFLSSRTLPTHPFDQLKEIDPFDDQSPNTLKSLKSECPSTPNLVARLMGLDSMPDTDTRRGSTRSKSMYSIDCRLGETEEVQGKHRRMKTSVYFRETQSYFELEDDDFFVLWFEDVEKSRTKEAGGERNQRRRRRRRTERIPIPKEQGRRHGFRIEGGDDLEAFVQQLRNLDDDDVKVVETESESENLSPVSILDHSCLFMGDPEAPTSAEEETTNGSSSPRRKLVLELSNLEHPSNDHNNEACSMSNDQESSEVAEDGQTGLRKKGYHRHQNVEMFTQICRLANAEMADLEWDFKGGSVRNFKKWEVEIGVELGLQIVDQLLDEVVHQLL